MVIKYPAQGSDFRQQNKYAYQLIPMDEDGSNLTVSW